MNPQDTVDVINQKLFLSPRAEQDYFRYLEFIESPVGDCIKYEGFHLWDSENDYREWNEEGTEQESLEEYLLKEIKKVHRNMKDVINALEESL